MDDFEAAIGIPKPWGQEKVIRGEKRYALTTNGKMAMGKLLLLHPSCVDAEKAAAVTGDKKAFFLELANGAKKFIEEHREHSCVPGMPADGLVVLMSLFALQCKFDAGIVDEDGAPIAARS